MGQNIWFIGGDIMNADKSRGIEQRQAKRYDKARIEVNPRNNNIIIRDMRSGQFLPKHNSKGGEK